MSESIIFIEYPMNTRNRLCFTENLRIDENRKSIRVKSIHRLTYEGHMMALRMNSYYNILK